MATPGGFARSRLGVDATRPLEPADWLALTGQSVLEVTAGAAGGHLARALAAATWPERDDALAAACDVLMDPERRVRSSDALRPAGSR